VSSAPPFQGIKASMRIRSTPVVVLAASAFSFFFHNAECSSPLGMEFGIISNHQITASSETAWNKKEWGRLNSAGWCVSGDAVHSVDSGKVSYHFLQIDLLDPHLIRGVATQGKQTANPYERPEAVTSFYLKYSFNGDEWFRYHKVIT